MYPKTPINVFCELFSSIWVVVCTCLLIFHDPRWLKRKWNESGATSRPPITGVEPYRVPQIVLFWSILNPKYPPPVWLAQKRNYTIEIHVLRRCSLFFSIFCFLRRYCNILCKIFNFHENWDFEKNTKFSPKFAPKVSKIAKLCIILNQIKSKMLQKGNLDLNMCTNWPKIKFMGPKWDIWAEAYISQRKREISNILILAFLSKKLSRWVSVGPHFVCHSVGYIIFQVLL